MTTQTVAARTHHRGGALLAVLAGGIALRAVFFLQVRQTFLFQRPFLDAGYYHRWALEIAGGDWAGVARGVFTMSPGYPYFLAVLYSLFGARVETAVLAQFALGLVSGWMIYLLGTRHLSRTAGLIGAAVYLAYPPALFYESTLLKAALINAVNLATLLAASTAGPAGALLAGLLTGVSAHLRPSALLLAPVLALWLWRRAPRKAPAAALFASGLLAALLPVAARNYRVGGEWIWTTAHGGMNFYTGNGPECRGPYQMLPFARTDVAEEQQAFLEEARRRAGRELTPAQASDFWYAESWRFIREQPLREAGLLLKKAVVFANGYEAPINVDFNLFRSKFGSLLALPLPSFAALLPLAVLGAARAAPNVLLLGYLASVLVANVVFFSASEYRFPAVPILCLYAGHAGVALAGDLRARSWRSLAVSCTILFVLGAFTYTDAYTHLLGLPRYKQEIAANSFYNLGVDYQRAGRDDDAILAYRESVRLRPDDAVTQNNLGVALARTGRISEATPHFEKALSGLLDAYYNLARALALLGRNAEAQQRLRQAEEIARSGRVREAIPRVEPAR
ncbi:MAG TPA: tetratricopeptide repeat protein [bacterium]